MNIGMILLGTKFPPDIRVQKEVEVLCKNSHKISLLTELRGESSSIDDTYISGLRIIRKKIASESIFYRWVSFSFLTLAHHRHMTAISEYLEEEKPDAIHVHDFTFLPAVFRAMSKIGLTIPVIADLHENMPAALVAYRSDLSPIIRMIKAIYYNYVVWRYWERYYLRQCSKVLVVVPEAAMRLKKYGIPNTKIAIVSNTENEKTFNFSTDLANKEILNRYRGEFVITYVGGIGPHRGLKTVFKAAYRIFHNITNLRILVVGAKSDDEQLIMKYIKKYSLNSYRDKIDIIKWVPFNDVNSYILASTVCLVPHENFEHTQTTIPHKLFQYMICGKPVLVSDCAPLKRVIGENMAGYVFKAGDSDDFARACLHIYNNPQEMECFAKKGREIALVDYSWSKDAESLLEVYRDLAPQY